MMSDEHAQPKHKYLVMQRHIGMSLPEGESLVSFFSGSLVSFSWVAFVFFIVWKRGSNSLEREAPW